MSNTPQNYSVVGYSGNYYMMTYHIDVKDMNGVRTETRTMLYKSFAVAAAAWSRMLERNKSALLAEVYVPGTYDRRPNLEAQLFRLRGLKVKD